MGLVSAVKFLGLWPAQMAKPSTGLFCQTWCKNGDDT